MSRRRGQAMLCDCVALTESIDGIGKIVTILLVIAWVKVVVAVIRWRSK